MELLRFDSGHDVVPEHKVANIGFRNENSLLTGETASLAKVEKALDLLINSTDCLNFTVLIDRAGDSK